MKIICIVGPTGVGKTKLSIELAKIYNGEIINADSTQIYKELDIATAKIKDKENIIHHLIDIKAINEDYTVFDYQKDARKCIEEIIEKNKTPIIVGGTGLYIKACLFDYKFNQEIKSNNYDDLTNEQLYNELIKIDPKTEIHINNRNRVIRALDYYKQNNQPISEKQKTDNLLYDTIFIGLTTNRELLYEKINNRVEEMFNEGLLDEALYIYKKNIKSKAVMTPIGYKELFDYFENKISLEEAKELIKQRSRKYAKRQYTWFNHQIKTNWFEVDYNNFNKTVEEINQFIGGIL